MLFFFVELLDVKRDLFFEGLLAVPVILYESTPVNCEPPLLLDVLFVLLPNEFIIVVLRAGFPPHQFRQPRRLLSADGTWHLLLVVYN